MSTRTGVVKCGSCHRSLKDPLARRQMTRGERKEFDALGSHVEQGRMMERLTPPKRLPGLVDWHVYHREVDGELRLRSVLVCKCGIRYDVDDVDLEIRRWAAYDRGENLPLGMADRERSSHGPACRRCARGVT